MRRHAAAVAVAAALVGGAAALGATAYPPPPAHKATVVGQVRIGPPIADTHEGDIAGPVHPLVGFGAVWVPDWNEKTLTRVDPGALEAAAPIKLPGHPGDLGEAAGLGAIWISLDEGYVVRVDPATSAIAAVIKVGRHPHGLALGAGRVWVVDEGDGIVRGIDPATNRVSLRTRVRPHLHGIVARGVTAYITVEDKSNPALVELNLSTAKVIRVVRTPEIYYVASGGGLAFGSLWANPGSGDIVRLNPRTLKLQARISSPGFDTWTGDRMVWTTIPPNGLIQRVDPAHNRMAGRALAVGAEKEDLAFGFGSVWATDDKDGMLYRISP